MSGGASDPPRAVAERAVGAMIANETATLPWVEDIDEWYEVQEALTEAVAAAIEWQDTRWLRGMQTAEAVEELRRVDGRLRRAVTELRRRVE